MDFFKSVFSSHPDPPPGDEDEDEEEPEEEVAEGELDAGTTAAGPDPDSPGGAEEEVWRGDGGGAWGGFSGLMRTLASRSETVIQTYRRDLEEFGSGLRKETAAIRDAIRDLPSSLETGASVAQESLESVGQAIDDLGGSVWRGTAEIIAQGKDALLSMDPDASADPASSPGGGGSAQGSAAVGASGRPYNRFEAKVLGIQSDPATFSEEPEDAEDFRAWMEGFQLAEKEAEVESLLAESRALEGNLARLVPGVVDYVTFWSRYFYKAHKLKQAEDVRANLVKRVISREEEEEDLSWEVEDDDTAAAKDSEQGEEQGQGGREMEEKQGDGRRGEEADVSVTKKEEADETKPDPVLGERLVENVQLENAAEIASAGESVPSEMKEDDSESNIGEAAIKVDDKMPLEGKGEPVESCKDSDVSVVSSQPSMPEEDDLGWDEIEDLGDHDEKKGGVSTVIPDKINLRKKLSATEEDEDLSWDIEDDDPIKS